MAAPAQFSTRNITRYFRSIDAATIAEGRNWYPKARQLAEELAGDYEPLRYFEDGADPWSPGSVERAAAVIAVLSPQLNWGRNVRLAHRAYEAWHYGGQGAVADVVAGWPGLKTNAMKAFRILRGIEDVDAIVKGPKVRQFWHTIVNPEDPRAVVVDRHAFAVAAGRVLNDEELGKMTGRAGTYDAVSQMYRNASKILSRELGSVITPAETQAITWTGWRREHAHTAKANRRDELEEN